MANNDASEEKREEATPKRKKDARQEGQVAKSKELNSFFVLLCMIIYLVSMRNYLIADGHVLFDLVFHVISQHTYVQIPMSQLYLILQALISLCFQIFIIPVVMSGFIAGLVAMIQAGGFIISMKVIELDIKKLNPVSNAKNIFSLDNLKKFAKDMLQLGVMFSLATFLVYNDIAQILNSSNYTFGVVVTVFFVSLLKIMVYMLGVYCIFAIIDVFLEKFKLAKNLRMSRHDIEQEMKNTEGNAEIKNKRREMHREMVEQDPVSHAVEHSSLVINNPTHISIVILFDPKRFQLPVILIKAQGDLATKVRQAAKKFDILMVRDVWLARMLYEIGEVGKYVPSSMIAHVAEHIGKNAAHIPQLQPDYVPPAPTVIEKDPLFPAEEAIPPPPLVVPSIPTAPSRGPSVLKK